MGSGQWSIEKRAPLRNESSVGDSQNVPETGCLSIIVLGASGDLAKKKTFPALFHLYRQGFIQSHDVHIFGYARSKISDDDLRDRIRGYLTPCKGCLDTHKEDVQQFLQLIKYVCGAYDTEEGFRTLDNAISEYELSKNTTEGSSRRLFYLALPPSVYPSVCKMIKNYCMNKSDLGGWTRIVVEKPFGRDLGSAEELSTQIGELFDEAHIYRIDHYLGKELVQNLLVLRFANRFFLPLWNRDNISNVQDSQNTPEIQPSTQASHESQTDQQNNATDAPAPDSGSVSISSNDNRKVSREDIELVQNLIERCLQLYMNRDEVVKTLLNRARIDPGFTTLVWQKLEEENADFFRAYYIRLKLKKQIILFNHLLEHQYHLMKYPVPPKLPVAPIQNGIHPMPVNNLPMGYPVLQQPPIPSTAQHHIDSMGISSCHVVNGVPAPGNFHPMRMNSGNESMVMESSAADVTPTIPANGAISPMSDMPMSPTSVASSGHFPFTASEISGMGVDTSALDTAFTSDVASSVGLHLPPDNVNSRSFGQIPWNFSLSDLTADLSNLGGNLISIY